MELVKIHNRLDSSVSKVNKNFELKKLTKPYLNPQKKSYACPESPYPQSQGYSNLFRSRKTSWSLPFGGLPIMAASLQPWCPVVYSSKHEQNWIIMREKQIILRKRIERSFIFFPPPGFEIRPQVLKCLKPAFVKLSLSMDLGRIFNFFKDWSRK